MSDTPVGPPKHIRTGQDGERLAAAALEQRGFTLVEVNWRCPYGELDAIMHDGEELVFVEVKTRTGAQLGSAEEAISPSKVQKLALAAESYLDEHPELGDPVWRIDLVAITLDWDGTVVRFTHIPNAALLG